MLKVISIIGYLSMVAGIIALLLTHRLFSWSPVVIALQVAGLALMIWARVTFGRRSYHFAANPTEGGLVTSGPYRFIRHPIYSAVCIFTLAGVAVHWSWQSAVIGGVVLAGAVVRLRCEEILLTKRYPDYVGYAARTWRLLPYLF
jgi:protein-S-isoprenylcysteine O-methyltransferase Ste14